MNEIFVTICGTVSSEVRRAGEGQNTRSWFRMTTVERYFDRATGQWIDRDPVLLEVFCWRRLAEHVAASVKQGDPVLVRGALRVRPKAGGADKASSRESLQVRATAVGHDLNRGTALFAHAKTAPPPAKDVA